MATSTRRLYRRLSWTIVIAGSLLVALAAFVRLVVKPFDDFGDNTYLESAQFTPDGHTLVTTTGGQVRVWDVASGRSLELLQIDGDAGEIGPDGHLLAVSRWDKTLDLWDLGSGRRVRSLSGLHADGVSFSPDGRLLLVRGDDGWVRLLELASGRTMRRFAAVDATFSQDGRLVVTVDGSRAQIRELGSGRVRLTVRGKPGSMALGVLSPDARLLLTLGVNRARLWDLRNGRLLHTMKVALDVAGERPPLYGAELTSDGGQLLLLTEESSELWDVASGRRVANFDDSGSATLSTDGRFLVTDSYSGGVQIRRLPTAAVLRVLRPGEGAPIYHTTFSPDGRLLVTTGDEDATVWDVGSGRRVLVLHHDVP